MGQSRWPQRVVCLTEETTQVLHRLGAGDKVVSASDYTVQPRDVRQKPDVSALTSDDVDRIVACSPDLVLTSSNLDPGIAELQRRGLWVVSFNPRSAAENLRAMVLTGALVGLSAEAERLAAVVEAQTNASEPGPRWPQRVVCLTEETTEVLYRLGAGDKVVGVSGYTVRPPEARQKPKVSAFISANIDRIVGLSPDLVLTFSDLQADMSAELRRRGLWVVSFNQRSIAEILRAIVLTGALVGLAAEAERLAAELEAQIDAVRERGSTLPFRPRVFFEEWPDPLISGIRWVSELISVAGGQDVFPECAKSQGAKGRIVSPDEVIRRSPDVIVASWCGRKARPELIRKRPGWEAIPAVQAGRIHEIKSTYILQPGPASLSEGLNQLHAYVRQCALAGRHEAPASAPARGVRPVT